MNGNRPLVSFDWAIKRLLRQKANYDVAKDTLDEWIYYLKNNRQDNHRIMNVQEVDFSKKFRPIIRRLQATSD